MKYHILHIDFEGSNCSFDDSDGEILSSFESSDQILLPKSKRGFSYINMSFKKAKRFGCFSTEGRHRRWQCQRTWVWLALASCYITCFVIIIWLSLILLVVKRLRIPSLNNGLHRILQEYKAPTVEDPASPLWLDDFSAGIIPVQCNSHNDYQQTVPLYQGLAAGCISTEADIWLGKNRNNYDDLLVGHNSRSLGQTRTLRSLYLDPLEAILAKQNSPSAGLAALPSYLPTSGNDVPVGVYSMVPNMSLVLLLDFKMDGDLIWQTVTDQLKPLRDNKWLTYWTPTSGIVQRPVTIVASGVAPFASITANSSYREIFYDAPITKISEQGSPYNRNNSCYASASLGSAVGSVKFGSLTKEQKSKVEDQVQKANEMGLKSRYWDTPSWPVGWRNRIWEALVGLGANVLNVDDVTAATGWDWQMCVVGGLNICNI
ncbi:hypothetical protein BJ875DRAFT_513760 [Amylocarpus encephaloides]|uniref:Altered inheritance of mitochondria protein 6 n=1 Tax=Amylocarpus encephaloides TaxID=45428 RepID=A0A9P7YFW4_9HELO|nr:hypothetical protein BJ875DRAFT_513760 [Amylocarpus encephaloides]